MNIRRSNLCIFGSFVGMLINDKTPRRLRQKATRLKRERVSIILVLRVDQTIYISRTLYTAFNTPLVCPVFHQLVPVHVQRQDLIPNFTLFVCKFNNSFLAFSYLQSGNPRISQSLQAKKHANLTNFAIHQNHGPWSTFSKHG